MSCITQDVSAVVFQSKCRSNINYFCTWRIKAQKLGFNVIVTISFGISVFVNIRSWLSRILEIWHDSGGQTVDITSKIFFMKFLKANLLTYIMLVAGDSPILQTSFLNHLGRSVIRLKSNLEIFSKCEVPFHKRFYFLNYCYCLPVLFTIFYQAQALAGTNEQS